MGIDINFIHPSVKDYDESWGKEGDHKDGRKFRIEDESYNFREVDRIIDRILPDNNYRFDYMWCKVYVFEKFLLEVMTTISKVIDELISKDENNRRIYNLRDDMKIIAKFLGSNRDVYYDYWVRLDW